ncbi:Hsp70 family protein [Aspergillus saccharolyticus JOP 1030-1]|uniref:Actin-like ATPase domain-containing protein n=1 Tax=Aspergillus saccharolyticus JOP 1030-1 TaxID=1450539 RepID=A0A318ZJ09_9EURO|nr:actin-like ATPase domain-containing protein [Aspergillus saccharolyticus JOP 1030-1]PYH46334.1 actin-like ATPase domain-containing protein [Aspergillus saccharolyticus JOP 1030-1]
MHEHSKKGAQGPSIVLGVDFGTTFKSRVAWAFKGSSDDIEVISTWPGRGNVWRYCKPATSAKVPSTLSYGVHATTWGYQVGPYNEAFRGFKLLLDQEQETEYPPSLACKERLMRYQTTAVKVTADYLRCLLRHIEGILERRLGIATQDMDLRFVLTVPAVWSDRAKDATLQAALDAGIHPQDVSLVSEPEAAALYSLRAIQPNSVARDDVFIVCDAGGGTVDLISYQVKSLEPLSLSEVVKGAGRVCGSMLLDERFEKSLEERMGPEAFAALPVKSREIAIQFWQDRVKPGFKGTYDNEYADVDYFIPIPGARDDLSIPIEDGFFFLTRSDIIAIILVGGFGASEFLFHRLQEANPTVTVMQPRDAGAVHRGLDGNQVENRIACRHYGVGYRTQYIESRHDPNDRYWDELEEKYMVDDRMNWYIKKYSKLSESEPIKMPFYCIVRTTHTAGFLLKNGLFFCNHEDAPDTKNNGTIQLCTLEADLSRVPRELFYRKRNSKGVEYFEIHFKLVMIPTSASLMFELEFNGVPYGSVRSKY